MADMAAEPARFRAPLVPGLIHESPKRMHPAVRIANRRNGKARRSARAAESEKDFIAPQLHTGTTRTNVVEHSAGTI